jgi:ATP-dependent DNA ligase
LKVYTRRGNDWTKRFRKIAEDASPLPAASAIIDGEVVVPAADGTTDFSVLQNELRGRSRKIVLVAFDLLFLNGHCRCFSEYPNVATPICARYSSTAPARLCHRYHNATHH